MASFGPKPSLNPCGKMAIFLTFLTSCFYNLEKRFFVLEYRKRQFSYLFYLKKKKLEKWPFFDQNHGLTPFEKCQIIDFLNFMFLYPRKAFFRSRISLTIFSWPKLPKKKRWTNGHFWTKTMG